MPTTGAASTIAGFGGGRGVTTTSAPGEFVDDRRAGNGGPTIVSFEVTRQPLCPAAPTAAEPKGTPGRAVTLAWQVTGTANVMLTIDDPAHTARRRHLRAEESA